MPFSDDDLERLEVMLDAADRIARYMDGIEMSDFVRRDMVFDAVCLNLIRIGEGGNFLSDKTQARLPVVHWPDVVTMRNRIAHGYRSLDETIIWLTAVESVPDLATMIRTLLARED